MAVAVADGTTTVSDVTVPARAPDRVLPTFSGPMAEYRGSASQR